MARKTELKLQDLYALMLNEQKRGGDFDLTIRDLMIVWKIPTSTSHVRYYLLKMVEKGLVKFRVRGSYRTYRAIERNTSDLDSVVAGVSCGTTRASYGGSAEGFSNR
jgi:hypothetical protein